MKSNEPTESRLKRKLYWHHPLVYLFILVNLLIYAIIAIATRKSATIQLPLAERYKKRRILNMIIAWGFVLASIGCLLAGLATPSSPIALLGFFRPFVCWLVSCGASLVVASSMQKRSTIISYGLEASLEIFLALFQSFPTRTAKSDGKLVTFCRFRDLVLHSGLSSSKEIFYAFARTPTNSPFRFHSDVLSVPSMVANDWRYRGCDGLLLLFAGVFHEKVPSESKVGPRSIPTGAMVVNCRRVTQPRYESAIGTIKPVHEADIAAKILARVIEVSVSAGKRVNAGDVLVKLSDDELVSRVRQAEAERDSMLAQLQLAQSEAARATQLIRTNALSRSEYDAAMTRVQTSQAAADRATRAVEEAKIYLSYATIVAPFSGMVVDKAVETGDTVTPGSVLLTMYDPTHMQLVANVRESLATKLKVGQVLGARLETQDYECQATISEVVPKADTASRSFEVKVTGPCPPGVYSGMFGRLLLPLEDEQLLLVPRQAIKKVGQLTQVSWPRINTWSVDRCRWDGCSRMKSKSSLDWPKGSK